MRRVALAVVAAALLGVTPGAGAATLYPSVPNVTVGADGGAAVAWLRADPAGRRRVYALTVGRATARAIRARRLTRLSAVVASPRRRQTTSLRVRSA